MKRITMSRSRSMLIAAAALAQAVPVQAGEHDEHKPDRDHPEFRYRFTSLLETLPDSLNDGFDPIKISNDGKVCGTAFGCPEGSDCSSRVACYSKGRWTLLDEGFAIAGNDRGKIGGFVIEDPAVGAPRAALFEGGQPVELLPTLPGEIFSQVLDLNDKGVALVVSFGAETTTYYLYRMGRVIPLALGPEASQLQLNDHELISGTLFMPEGDRAFRFDSRSSELTLLEPLPTEPNSWGQGINDRGDVLGYSFFYSDLERIGIWRGEKFHTYFVEGTPEFPTVSNRLLFNENDLIVITDSSVGVDGVPDLNSYLVPKPKVRIPLADVSDELQPWTLVTDLNDCGDLIGYAGPERFSFEQSFLLENLAAPAACRKARRDGQH